MLVKICGITRAEDAERALQGGADLLGLIFAKSPRQVSVDGAEAIIRKAGYPEKFVAVFVNEPVPAIHKILKFLGLGWVQLHGNEARAWGIELRQAGHRVIKACRVQSVSDIEAISKFPSDYLLFDSFQAEKAGGTGKTFDWNLLKQASGLPPFFLSGGISLENVERAIQDLHPAGIDISSSLEARPGEKDPVKLENFLKKVRQFQHA